MLRHCANTLAARRLDSLTLKKPWANVTWESRASFIHLSNLIAFFTTKHSLKGSDLRFGSPRGLVWKALDETKYSDLRDQVQALNAGYSETFKNANTPSDCYDLISKDTFLLRLFHHNCRPVTVCRTRMSDTNAANALPPFPKTAPV